MPGFGDIGGNAIGEYGPVFDLVNKTDGDTALIAVSGSLAIALAQADLLPIALADEAAIAAFAAAQDQSAVAVAGDATLVAETAVGDVLSVQGDAASLFLQMAAADSVAPLIVPLLRLFGSAPRDRIVAVPRDNRTVAVPRDKRKDR